MIRRCPWKTASVPSLSVIGMKYGYHPLLMASRASV